MRRAMVFLFILAVAGYVALLGLMLADPLFTS